MSLKMSYIAQSMQSEDFRDTYRHDNTKMNLVLTIKCMLLGSIEG